MGGCLNHRLHGLHGLKSRDWIGRDVGRVSVGRERAREPRPYVASGRSVEGCF